MKFIKWWINNFTVGVLYLVSVLSIIDGLLLTGSLIFGYNPYYKTSNMSFGFTDFEKGIPLKITFNNSIPDTSIRIQTTKSSISGDDPGKVNQFLELQKSKGDSLIVKADSTILHYKVLTWNNLDDLKDKRREVGELKELRFSSGSLHITPSSMRAKIFLMLPVIFDTFLIAYVFWQLATFLQKIRNETSFDASNYKRLRNIGLSLLFYNLVLFLWDHYFYHLTFIVTRSSTNTDNGDSLSFSVKPDLPYGFSYFLGGVIFLILASAFKKGHSLQQEQSLTI